jgi:hypothetical protein
LEKLRPCSEGGGLPKSGALELGGEILLEFSGHPASFVFEAGRAELPLLDQEAQAEGHQRDAR